MASDQVFIPATNQNPTPVSGPVMSKIPRIFTEDTSSRLDIYFFSEQLLPATIVLDLGEITPVNTLEISTF